MKQVKDKQKSELSQIDFSNLSLMELLRLGSGALLKEAIASEITQHLGRGFYQHLSGEQKNIGQRNGYQKTTLGTRPGISLEGDVLDLAVKYELIEKSGAWYSHNGERMGQGREQSVKFLKENPKLTAAFREQILDRTIRKTMTDTAATHAAADARNGAVTKGAAGRPEKVELKKKH